MRVCACLTVLPAISLHGAVAVDARGRRLDDAAVAPDDRAHRQPELAPPDHVGGVAERADHGDARALLGIGELVRDDGHLDVEERRADGRAEQRLVARVVGMGDDGDARGEQLGAGRLDEDGLAVAVERKPMRWYAPGRSRSSSSAWATAVLKSTSHSVGASAR